MATKAAKVLIVEDDSALRTVYEMIVKSGGYQVATAEDGAEGLERLAEFQPDVVLLDMLMPVKSGLELLQEANLPENYPNTKVIIFSNLSDSDTIDEALRLGAVRHMIKSNTLPPEILAAIKEQL